MTRDSRGSDSALGEMPSLENDAALGQVTWERWQSPSLEVFKAQLEQSHG